MASAIHFTSGETVAVTADAKDVTDQIGKGKKFTLFVLAAIPMEIYVASDAVTYVADLSVHVPPLRD
jgi:hypothetical protein